MATVVFCLRCREVHRTSEIKCLDVEESIEGWDMLEFVCPETGDTTKAVVRDDGRGNATSEEYEEVYGR